MILERKCHFLLVTFICVCAYAHVCTCVGNRTICGSHFSHIIKRVSGTEFRSLVCPRPEVVFLNGKTHALTSLLLLSINFYLDTEEVAQWLTVLADF